MSENIIASLEEKLAQAERDNHNLRFDRDGAQKRVDELEARIIREKK
jgi:septation ring formation regulator EzrA